MGHEVSKFVPPRHVVCTFNVTRLAYGVRNRYQPTLTLFIGQCRSSHASFVVVRANARNNSTAIANYNICYSAKSHSYMYRITFNSRSSAKAEELPRGTSRGMSQGTSQETSQGTLQGTLQDTSQGILQALHETPHKTRYRALHTAAKKYIVQGSPPSTSLKLTVIPANACGSALPHLHCISRFRRVPHNVKVSDLMGHELFYDRA
jgi:hypothetical protein